MSKFKVGDKVRCIESSKYNHFPNVLKGQIYTIDYISDNYDVVYIKEYAGLGDINSVFKISYFKLVETETVKPDIKEVESSGQALSNTVRNLIDSQLEFKKCWTQVKISTDEYEVVITKK